MPRPAAAAEGRVASSLVYAGSGGQAVGVAADRPSLEQGGWRPSRLMASLEGGCFVVHGEWANPCKEDGPGRGERHDM